MNRRDFIKTSSLLLVTALLDAQLPASRRLRQTNAGANPNILLVVFDTLAAPHMALHGYPRATAPHLERFAQRATVFHRHYAAANFTTPGTASLVTGTYPWTHRAFNHAGTLAAPYREQNLFGAFANTPYYRVAYSHNLLAHSLLNQCRQNIDLHLPAQSFCLFSGEVGERLFSRDPELATRALDDLLLRRDDLPGSLFLSLADRVRMRLQKSRGLQGLHHNYPRGVPELFKLSFVLEDAIDGITETLDRTPHPFLAYFHLLPPHEPYRPHRDFIDLFDDDWSPQPKPESPFSDNVSGRQLRQQRRHYDEFLAYSDAQFGRLLDYLQQSGRLDDTIVIFTSDHGQLFERGIHGHVTETLYDPLIHVPLLISQPGQQTRHDVRTPTSCVDLVPTLLQLSGQEIPAWCEGRPLFSEGAPGAALPTDAALLTDDDSRRSVYALEAKRNPKQAPLTTATASIVQEQYKLTGYFGYGRFDDAPHYELFDLQADPEEQNDLYPQQPAVVEQLVEQLRAAAEIQ